MTTTHNPAAMLSSAAETGAFDGVASFFVGLASAAQQHPVMTVTGIAAVAAVMYAARHLTHVSNETARKTAEAYAATRQATTAVHTPGKLDPHVRAAAMEDSAIVRAQKQAIHEAHAVIAKARGMEGVDVHYVESPAGWAPTMPAPFQR